MLDILAWARRFVATPSVSRDGNAEMAALACELLREIGGSPRSLPSRHDGVEQHTVIADFGPAPGDATEGVLLVTHLDTVPPGPEELWTETGGDPFEPTEREGRLYGLGSADAKVDLVCKAAALEQLGAKQLDRPLRVVGTFAEEIGLVGARWLVERGHTRGFRDALVSEPSELVAIRAHKGYAVFDARIPLPELQVSGQVSSFEQRGHSAHSSTPELGRNAIEAALDRLGGPDVQGLLALSGGGATNQVPALCSLRLVTKGSAQSQRAFDPAPLVSFAHAWRSWTQALAEKQDPDFDPDHSVANLGRVLLEGGTVSFRFDLRPIPGVDPEAAVQPLAEYAELACRRINPPLATAGDARLIDAIREGQRALGLGCRVGTKATCTEAGLLSEAGLEAVVLGPGVSVGNVHRPNEHTRIDELGLARDLYRHTLERLCTGEA